MVRVDSYRRRNLLSFFSSDIDLKRIWIYSLLVVFSQLVLSIQAQEKTVGPTPEMVLGRQLAWAQRDMAPESDRELDGWLKLRDERGRRTEIPFRLQVKIDGLFWESIYHAPGNAVRPTERVRIRRHPTEGAMYWKSIGEEIDFQAATVDQRYGSFSGTDFYPADLGLEFFYWEDQVWEGSERRKGRMCDVVISRPSPNDNSLYSKVKSWIDHETQGLLAAEAYDEDGKEWKAFSIRRFKKVDGVWRLREMEILDQKKDTRTRIEFDLAFVGESGSKD